MYKRRGFILRIEVIYVKTAQRNHQKHNRQPEYEKAYLKKQSELSIQKEYLKKIKEREYSGNKYIENFKKHRNITELSREVILSLVEEVIVFKDKKIKINLKFKDEYKKMMSIIDIQ